jgi:hypothetical protein
VKRLALVVEGPTDKSFFQTLRSWFEALGFTVSVTTAHNKERLIRDAPKHLAAHRYAGRDIIGFVLDQHDDECPPATASRLSQVMADADVLIAVVGRCLESWLLADEAAISAATGRNYQCHGMTDESPDPVREIRDLFYRSRGQHLSKTEIVRAIAPRFDLERAVHNSRSLRRFRDRLVSLADE